MESVPKTEDCEKLKLTLTNHEQLLVSGDIKIASGGVHTELGIIMPDEPNIKVESQQNGSSQCTQKSCLPSHLLIHSGEKLFECTRRDIYQDRKPYECNICSYKCTLNSDLRKPLRAHSGEKPFECQICSYKCSAKSSLNVHMRSHSGEKPFTCDICSYRCTQSSSLQKHLRIHSGEKPYECNVCDYKCTEKNSLQKHLYVHSGEKPQKSNLLANSWWRKAIEVSNL